MKPTMMTYIHQQPEVLSHLLACYPQGLPVLGKAKTVLILATGSSINAALSAKYYVEQLTGVRISVAGAVPFSALRAVGSGDRSGDRDFTKRREHFDAGSDRRAEKTARRGNLGHHPAKSPVRWRRRWITP